MSLPVSLDRWTVVVVTTESGGVYTVEVPEDRDRLVRVTRGTDNMGACDFLADARQFVQPTVGEPMTVVNPFTGFTLRTTPVVSIEAVR